MTPLRGVPWVRACDENENGRRNAFATNKEEEEQQQQQQQQQEKGVVVLSSVFSQVECRFFCPNTPFVSFLPLKRIIHKGFVGSH